jgi:hypothetical protein
MGGQVKVKHEDAGESPAWTIENAHLSVRLVLDGLGLTVTDKASGKRWQMEPEGRGFMVQKYGIQLIKPLETLNLADWREAREGDFHGVELRSVQPDPWQQYNVRVRVLLAAETPELRISVAPHEDPGYNSETWLREVYYPRSFLHSSSPKALTVLPFQQGTLLPGDWPEELRDELAARTLRLWAWEAVTGPWWGHIDEGGAGYLAIIDTPDDVTFDFVHPAGGPTRIAPYWNTSFEAFRYARCMVYRFYPRADHVALALGYRDYCKRIGRWRSIEEKRLEKPQLDKLRGAVGFRIMALLNSLGRKGAKVRRQFRSFHEIAGVLHQAAAEHRGENVYFILAGWQTLGYDHAHPAACPPNAEAGGWDGMREISDVASEHGFLFGVHDQYRDFFYSSPFWSEGRTRKDSRRDSPRHAYWAGGTQSILCPALMLDFVKMNVQQLRDQKIALNATYQDVLTAIAPEECYDHEHPLTRGGCLKARYDVLDYYRTLEWLITTESASDWAVPALDSVRVHWARTEAHGNTGPVGIQVPLFSLVFHDAAIMVSGSAPALLCALSGTNSQKAEDRVLRRLHKAVAYMPLSAHRLLSEDGAQQESVFGDQVRVRADLSAGTYSISGLPGEGEVKGELHDGRM